jgi:hypothetical protein
MIAVSSAFQGKLETLLEIGAGQDRADRKKAVRKIMIPPKL